MNTLGSRAPRRRGVLHLSSWFLLVSAAHVCACTDGDDRPDSPPDDTVTEVTEAAVASASRREDASSVAVGAQPLLQAAASNRGDVVGILTSRGVEEQLCTGTVLLPNLVLTARHCITTERSAMSGVDCSAARVSDPDPLTRVVVIAGRDVDLVPEDATHAVREFLLPDDEGKLCGQDLALLRLEVPLTKATLVVPEAVQGGVKAGTPFTAVGYGLFDGDWGQQRENPNAQVVCAGIDCSDPRITANEFLANAGACEGDSGGPAFDAKGSQIGLASRSTPDCAQTAYLGLADHIPWLKTVTAYAAQAGGLELPAWAKATDNRVIPVPVPGATEPVAHLSARGGCALVQGSRHSRHAGSFGLAVLALWAVLIRRSCSGRNRDATPCRVSSRAH
ncbi:MAG TPA: trypsin-like serine protease [Polyangiaceae bacterium]|nr:trypsin-like serine protease [Polyangiaceae bacterium]